MTPTAITLFFVLVVFSLQCSSGKYEPTWKSIDSRPLPDWYDEGKIGIFIHWGVFSVQSFSTEWAWFNWRGELKTAFENYTNIKFGLYHSLYEWYNPLYLADKSKNFTDLGAVNFVDSKILPEMIELVERYHPHVLWSDGDWEAPSSYWKSPHFLAWLYNDSPVRDTVVVNDRWGQDCLCKHGGFLTCADRYNPGKLQGRKFENAFTIDRRSWGYRRTANLADFLTVNELIVTVTQTVSTGGNVNINIGPTKDGVIAPIYEERLRQLGAWMKVNGEAMYSSKPWSVCQNDSLTPGVWYTTNKEKTILYATFSPWPVDNIVKMSCPEFTNHTQIKLLGLGGRLNYSPYSSDVVSGRLVEVQLPDRARVSSEWVWTLRIKGVKNIAEISETTSEREFQSRITVTKSNQQMFRKL